MNSATDRDYDLEATVRHPISVAQLLEREGFRPTERSRAARRALSGVTAGAVLALGAVVSTLFLNHGTRTTSGDTLASGAQSGGDIVLAESSPSAGATVVRTAVATAESHLPAKVTVPDLKTMAPRQADTGTAPDNSGHVRVRQNRASTPATTASTGKTQAAMRSAPTTTPAAPATTTDTTSNSTAGTLPPTTTPPTTRSTPTTTPPATTTDPAPTTVPTAPLTSVDDLLNAVTQPVFNWFGG